MELVSILAALIMNTVNLMVSIFYVKRIINDNWRTFVRKFYTMMIIRFAIVLILFFVFLKIFKMDELYLGLTFILSYFIVLIIEILYLNKRYSIFFKRTLRNN